MSILSIWLQHVTGSGPCLPGRRERWSISPVTRCAGLPGFTPLPVLAFTSLPEVRSQLALTWGTETFIVPHIETTDGMIRQVDKSMLELNRYKRGDLVVIVAGAPPGTVGSTNLISNGRAGRADKVRYSPKGPGSDWCKSRKLVRQKLLVPWELVTARTRRSFESNPPSGNPLRSTPASETGRSTPRYRRSP